MLKRNENSAASSVVESMHWRVNNLEKRISKFYGWMPFIRGFLFWKIDQFANHSDTNLDNQNNFLNFAGGHCLFIADGDEWLWLSKLPPVNFGSEFQAEKPNVAYW